MVADDSVLFREGLVRLLVEKGHEVLDAVGDATALQEAVERNQPDLAVIDVRMPPAMESDGAKSAAALRARHPGLGLLLLSQHIELHHVLPLVGTPGFGYLLKDRVLNLAEFTAAAERVATGGSALDPAVVQALVLTRAGSALDDLSEREIEQLYYSAQNYVRLKNRYLAEAGSG